MSAKTMFAAGTVSPLMQIRDEVARLGYQDGYADAKPATYLKQPLADAYAEGYAEGERDRKRDACGGCSGRGEVPPVRGGYPGTPHYYDHGAPSHLWLTCEDCGGSGVIPEED